MGTMWRLCIVRMPFKRSRRLQALVQGINIASGIQNFPNAVRSFTTSGGPGGTLKRTKGGGFATTKSTRGQQPKRDRKRKTVRGGKKKEQQQQEQQSSNNSASGDTKNPSSSSNSNHWTHDPERLWTYRNQAWTATAKRATPLILLGSVVAFSDDGNRFFYSYLCPIQIEQLAGPSMLPAIHPYGDTWLHTTRMWDSIRQVYHSAKSVVTGQPSPLYQCGQIVIFRRDPQQQQQTRACKRIIGMEGDVVQRYGQFAEYYRHREDLGVRWETLQARGLDPSCPWDNDDKNSSAPTPEDSFAGTEEQSTSKPDNDDNINRMYNRTLVVPKDHVWLEGDNPLLSVDSRHYGPIPISYLEGKLVWRLWPLLRHPAIRKHDQMILKHRTIRPQPLDVETIPDKQRGQEDRLALYYNLHRVRPRKQQAGGEEELDREEVERLEFTSERR